jgi:hypothetical protein
MANTSIVPFGKYKGQPVEVLAQDREYCDWLMNQEWFRTKFVGIHTLIVNHFGEPADTPEHNALQARFLDSDWCVRFSLALGIRQPISKIIQMRLQECRDFLVQPRDTTDRREGLENLEERLKMVRWRISLTSRQFEVDGYDVGLEVRVESEQSFPEFHELYAYSGRPWTSSSQFDRHHHHVQPRISDRM